MKHGTMLPLALSVAIASCAGPAPPSSPLPVSPLGTAGGAYLRRPAGASPIKHVIILFQENRSTDYLFQSPKLIAEGADIAQSGLDSHGDTVPLREVSLAAGYDIGHGHAVFLTDYDNGKMDGWDLTEPAKLYYRPYGYAPASEVQPYWDMATQFAFADRMFQTNQSSSYPSHQYIVSATARALPKTVDEIEGGPYYPKTKKDGPAGCDAPPNILVDTINLHSGMSGPSLFPCFDRPVLSDFLDQQGVSWRYYQRNFGPGWWHAMDSVKHVRYGPDYADVVSPPQSILSDIATGNLPGFAWVMPADDPHSDHAGNRSASGPSWIAAVVNAVGNSQYWDSTAIFVTWDDWGGWYDHVRPKIYNKYELGFRVPLVIVSAYARPGYVSHRQHEFASMLAFAEKVFGIHKGALHGTDMRADDLMDAFDFKQSPRKFVTIKAPPFVPGRGSPAELDAEDY
ncbi:MAG TPA: alkaline phosphatase family protein [Candidatus Tumulicola sp.]|jgi:phospholipase C